MKGRVMEETSQQYCADDALMAAVELAGRDDDAGLLRLAGLLQDHPADPRLHFLRGSLLAGQTHYAAAHEAMARAVALAPDYAIARFQLGLLELSSGDGAAADLTLQPLAEAGSEDALVLFARGLRHLARDEMEPAAASLRDGIRANREHPLISRDMQLIIDKIEEGPGAPPQSAAPAEDDVSAAHLLLRQYSDKTTKH
jgi:predicted Zn-dependent protease